MLPTVSSKMCDLSTFVGHSYIEGEVVVRTGNLKSHLKSTCNTWIDFLPFRPTINVP